MVKLAEWRGKELLAKYGIPLPRSVVVRTPAEAESAVGSAQVPLPCVLKAQVLAGGRGKAGFIREAKTPAEAASVAGALLGAEFKGETVKELLVEERLAVERELYVALTLDRSARTPLLMASGTGGVEIESVDEAQIARVPVHPFSGLTAYEVRKIAEALGLPPSLQRGLSQLLASMWKLFQQEDAELVEINPLALVNGRLIALDAKLIIEDDASFRHPEYALIQDDRTPLEEIAREKGIAFVQLEGDIGVIANGAGLTMATLDVLAQFGGRPGIFLDLGGTDDPAKVTEAFLLMAQAKPSSVFLNIFGGVTRCDTVAKGLVEAMKQIPPADRFPLVARIRGNNEAEGVAILRNAGITALAQLDESARAAVAAAAPRAVAPSGRP